MIKDEKTKKLKNVAFNSVSAILIVLFWFILYYFFENHGWQCSSKEECLRIHQGTDWEWWNDITFCIVYFLIEVVNCRLTDVSFWNYALIQAILDVILFLACMMFMEKVSWFVPITGVNGYDVKYTRFKALIYYGQQYILAFFVSYLVMGIIYGIRNFLEERKGRK